MTSELFKNDITTYLDPYHPMWHPFNPDFPYLGVLAIVIYLTVITVLWVIMKDKKPFQLNTLLGLHNLFLCFLSTLMAGGIFYNVVSIFLTDGLYGAYCGSPPTDEPLYGQNYVYGANQKLFLWTNVFYISKYYELLDTVFVVLRKKELTFLHVYHHCIVILVCWYATQSEIIMGWITAFDNAFVHMFMYYYYAIQSFSRRNIWWRKYLTSLQIVQFFLDMVTSVGFPYFRFNGIPCKGTMNAWYVANFTGFSFFLLFMNFYKQQYKTTRQQKKTE